MSEGVPLRVMLVDDHEVVRRGLSSLIDAEDGLEVVGEAGDGPEGVELAASFHDKYNARPLHILDLGAGTGGVSAALAAGGKHRVVAVDVAANEDLRELRARSGYWVRRRPRRRSNRRSMP